MLSEEGKAKAIAFDEIDKAPEERKRGITIATVMIIWWWWWFTLFFLLPMHILAVINSSCYCMMMVNRLMWSMKLKSDTMLMWIARGMPTMSK